MESIRCSALLNEHEINLKIQLQPWREIIVHDKDLSWLVQDPQQVKNFPRSFRGKVRSATQRRKQRAEEVMGLMQFAESHACLDLRQITAALRIQNPRLWLEYTQNRCASCKDPSLRSAWPHGESSLASRRILVTWIQADQGCL